MLRVWLALLASASCRCHYVRSHSLRSYIHLDLLRFRFLALRKAQCQHAIVIIGLDVVRFHGGGQREAPAERAVGAFDAQIVVLLHLAFELSFAANGEDIILHADVQILRIHIRQVRLNHQFIFRLVDVHGWGPGGQVRLLGSVSYAFAKHAIDLIPPGRSPAGRLFPTIHSSHVRSSSIIKYTFTMSARTAYVQTYNINYLINISGAVAVPYAPVQNACQRQSAHALHNSSSSSLIAG